MGAIRLKASLITPVRPYRVLSTSDEAAWHGYLDAIERKELIHFPRYVRGYEKYGDGTGECFVYESGGGTVLFPYLRRPIPNAAPFTDIATAYGYGGIAYSCSPGQDPAALIRDFRAAFEDHALATNTVSEFVRFHPHLANHEHFHGLMDEVVLSCHNAIIDLSVGADAVFKGYRTGHQQCIRKAEAAGLTVEPMRYPDFVDPFYAMYSASMERKHQAGYYRFRRDFLVHLADELGDNLKAFVVKRDGEILAVALFLHYGTYLDYFLAASRPETLTLRPNHLMLHKVAMWAIDAGVAWFHLGGGHKTLQFFKHSFANQGRDYYVGKHVFNKDVYRRLSEDHWRRNGRVWTSAEAFFPAYRAEFY